MSNPMDIINEILDGGYTAPLLADKANSKDATYAEEGERLMNHLKQFTSITMQLRIDQSTTYRDVRIEDDAVRAYCCTFEVRVPIWIGDYQIHIRANRDGVPQCVDNVRYMDTADKFPEEVIVDLIKGRPFVAPFTVDGEATWNGKLANRLGAADIRNSMLAAVKTALEGNSSGECDTFRLVIGLLPDKKQFNKGIGKLTKGQFQDLARLFFSVGANVDATRASIPNQIPHDFGLKNVDDLLCVIIAATDLYRAELLPNGRYPLCEFERYYQTRLREAQTAGAISYSEIKNKAALKAFITFLGGKLR